MEVILLIQKGLGIMSDFLLQYCNWYVIIFIYAFIYVLYFLWVTQFIAKELKKRKEIMQDIHLYKVTHPKELYPPASDEQMKSIFNWNQPQYPESYYNALEQIIKKWNGRPLLTIFLVISQYLIFISLLGYHLFLSNKIVDSSIFYFVDVLILAPLMLGRKRLWLRVIFYVIMLISYRFFSPEALYFIGIVSAVRLTNKIYVYTKIRASRK